MNTLTSHRKRSLTAGILYLITFVSIPTLALYHSVKSTNYITGSGPDTAALIGGISEVIIAIAGIATAIVLYPMLKKQSESGALGLVAARILESASIIVGVGFILTIVALRRDGSGAESLPVAHALATMYDRIFLLSQSFMPAICDLILGFLLYKSGLVPKALCRIGIVGGPLLIISYLAVFFNIADQHGSIAVLALPVAIFEFSLGVYLIVKGFKPEAVAALEAKNN